MLLVVKAVPERKMERFLSEAELARLGNVLAEAERTRGCLATVVGQVG